MDHQEVVAQLMELDDKLLKIRSQINSKLDNQKHVAIILTSVEESIYGAEVIERDPSKNLVNYLVALMTLLDQCFDPQSHAVRDTNMARSVTYLLDLIFHYTPRKLLKSHFAEILTKIAPCIVNENAEAALVKSAVGCLEAMLIAQDAQGWNNTHNLKITPHRGLEGIIELSMDHRPKVRKRALEAIYEILKNPPVAPSAEHIASPFIAELAIKNLTGVLEDLASTSNKRLKAENVAHEFNNRIIKGLKFISTIVTTGQWPATKADTLCQLLLQVTRSSDQYLVSNAFECFENFFESMARNSVSSGLAENKFLAVLDTISSLQPSTSDPHLVGAWIAVMSKGMSTYSTHEPLKAFLKMPDLFQILSTYLAAEKTEVYMKSYEGILSILKSCIKDETLLTGPDIEKKMIKEVNETLEKLFKIISNMMNINYAHSAKEVLNILASLFSCLKSRSYPFFIEPLKVVDQWRMKEDDFMELKSETEHVIGSAIRAIGPERLLEYMPLNLMNPTDDRPGRAWLLPIIRDYTAHSKLSIFIDEFSPLITYFDAKIEKLPKESVQLKIYETVVDQLWSSLPRFCDLPSDLVVSFTDEFASELSSVLYSKVHLRKTICNALKILVESNINYINDILPSDLLLNQEYSKQKAKQSLEYLSKKSVNILSVLFNVYTQTLPNARGYILETVESYFKITGVDDVNKTFNNVCTLLKKSLDAYSSKEAAEQAKLASTLLDIVVCSTKYLPESSYPILFSIFATTIKINEPAIQKKAYRIISRLSEIEHGSEEVLKYISNIEEAIIECPSVANTSSRASRMLAIKTIVTMLPNNHLHWIVQLVPEVILATKDANERTRDAAFETLIAMGEKMNQPNGSIKLSLISGYDSTTADQPSSISEFFKILSAGLIGESQHMVSSTITGYACLVFHFRDQLDPSLLMEIYDTIELYLTSNSREIAKSAIGFTKVCILGFPEELMRPKVPELLIKLLRWSSERTVHFKSKVKHIIERLIRKYGYDYIEQHFPENDKRLLANIRKIRNRTKRRDNDSIDMPELTEHKKGPKFMSALDEALYGSSSEDDDNEDGSYRDTDKNHNAKKFIMESGENPLDLLDSQTLSHISSARPQKVQKNLKTKYAGDDIYSFDADGHLVVKGENRTKKSPDDPLQEVNNGINAYLEAIENGPVRGQRNRLKFKRGSKNFDNANDNDNDVEKLKYSKKPTTSRHKVGKFKKGPKFKASKKL